MTPTRNNVEPTTSATEELRRLLDERGVEWTANDGEYVKETCWPYMGELMAVFAEYDNGETRFACDTWCFTPEQAIAATLGETPTPPPPTPPKQPPYDELIESLRRDWGIEASWDGLRRFWSIELTESGCLMRDRACNAEAENDRLRELVRDMWHDGMCECDERGACAECEYGYLDRMRELGIEVGA